MLELDQATLERHVALELAPKIFVRHPTTKSLGQVMRELGASPDQSFGRPARKVLVCITYPQKGGYHKEDDYQVWSFPL